MANGTVNKVFLIGNIVKPPEIKRTDKCDFVHLSLSTTEKWRDKTSNEVRERSEWHQIVIYGKLVDIVDKYVHTGDKINVIGRIQTRRWADDNNIEREKVEIIGEEIQLLQSRNKAGDHWI